MAKASKESKSKSGPTKSASSASKVNRSAFIRSVPATTPANDVVKLAAAKGIKINAGLVYAVRSADKSKSGAPKRKPGRPPKAASAHPATTSMPTAPRKDDLRHQFVSIAVRIGTDEAQRLLHNLIDVQTQVGKSLGK